MSLSLAETIARADALYDERSSLENVRTSVRELEEAASAGEYEAAWRLGRALFFLGQEAQNKAETHRQHARAVAFCQQAVRLRPPGVEGHFWLGVNLALRAVVENPFQRLRSVLSAKKSLQRAVRLDAAYHGAGPLRVLARLEHKLPRPFGGGKARARANFERALQLAPANTVTRLYFAEMLLEMGDTVRARLELETLLHAPTDPRWAFEAARDREIARQLLDKISD
jgi:tetratricopeptide (TPR) repeat protein